VDGEIAAEEAVRVVVVFDVAQAVECGGGEGVGRGLTGLLRVAFIGAAGGQLLAGAVELFRQRRPDCDVRLREAQMGDLMPWLLDGEVDVTLASFPVDEPGIATGPVLVSEARMLAVPIRHPFA